MLYICDGCSRSNYVSHVDVFECENKSARMVSSCSPSAFSLIPETRTDDSRLYIHLLNLTASLNHVVNQVLVLPERMLTGTRVVLSVVVGTGCL